MKKKVLIVDEDAHLVSLMKTLFEQEGFQVFTVTEGTKCIQQLQQGFEGIVLLDIIRDGWDTLQEIIDKNLQEKINIFVFSAVPSVNNDLKTNKSSLRQCTTEVYTPEALVKTITDSV
jgi:DNA-binding response OmpR family regulator